MFINYIGFNLFRNIFYPENYAELSKMKIIMNAYIIVYLKKYVRQEKATIQV